MLDRHTTPPGRPPGPVYPVREDTELMLPFADAGPTEPVLEIGTGNGALAVRAARSAGYVVATDRNPHALRALAARVRQERLPILLVRTDLARGTRRFSRILANPPYLPTRRGTEDPDRWHDLALNGGPDGTRVTARLFREFRQHLAAGGRAYLLVSSLQAPAKMRRLAAAWRSRTGTIRTVAERTFEGERLEIWELTRRPNGVSRARRPRKGSGAHPPSRSDRRSGSNRATGSGRSRVPDGASARRRSPRDS